jgi:hypothetical protein
MGTKGCGLVLCMGHAMSWLRFMYQQLSPCPKPIGNRDVFSISKLTLKSAVATILVCSCSLVEGGNSLPPAVAPPIRKEDLL